VPSTEQSSGPRRRGNRRPMKPRCYDHGDLQRSDGWLISGSSCAERFRSLARHWLNMSLRPAARRLPGRLTACGPCLSSRGVARTGGKVPGTGGTVGGRVPGTDRAVLVGRPFRDGLPPHLRPRHGDHPLSKNFAAESHVDCMRGLGAAVPGHERRRHRAAARGGARRQGPAVRPGLDRRGLRLAGSGRPSGRRRRRSRRRSWRRCRPSCSSARRRARRAAAGDAAGLTGRRTGCAGNGCRSRRDA